MRLWSLSPAYLDQKGLVACWREALLAQHVLLGRTKGYTRHPQLERFRAQPDPVQAIGAYLRGLQVEAGRRGYHFDESKIATRSRTAPRIAVTRGQIEFECQHLMKKLQVRDPERARQLLAAPELELHPLFYAAEGCIEAWERG